MLAFKRYPHLASYDRPSPHPSPLGCIILIYIRSRASCLEIAETNDLRRISSFIAPDPIQRSPTRAGHQLAEVPTRSFEHERSARPWPCGAIQALRHAFWLSREQSRLDRCKISNTLFCSCKRIAPSTMSVEPRLSICPFFLVPL